MDLSIDADGVTLSGEEDGRGDAGRPAARPDGDAPLRRDGLAGARALRPPRDRLRRARPRPVRSGGDDYSYDRLADGPARRARRPRDRAGRAGRRLDGRAHAHEVRARRTPSASPALVIMTPAYDPEARPRLRALGLARRRACANGGVEGFVEAYGTPNVPEKWHETIDRVLHQRLSAHEHPEALADALEAVPRSRPFEDWGDLRRDRRADGRRRQPRRGRPRAPVRGRRALRARRSRARSSSPRTRAPRRWPGRARRSRRSSSWRTAAAAP